MSVSMGRMVKFAALAAFVGAGLMQGAEQATFHLPFTAHWGQAVLEPGDYKMLLPAPSALRMELLVTGPHKTVFELPLITDVQHISNSSHLTLWKLDGDYFVRELSFGPSGKTFTFSVPKTSHRVEVSKREISSLAVAGN